MTAARSGSTGPCSVQASRWRSPESCSWGSGGCSESNGSAEKSTSIYTGEGASAVPDDGHRHDAGASSAGRKGGDWGERLHPPAVCVSAYLATFDELADPHTVLALAVAAASFPQLTEPRIWVTP